MIEKRCAYKKCNKVFHTNLPHKKYCVPLCEKKANGYQGKGYHERDYGNGVCPICGKEFKRNSAHHKYDIQECKDEGALLRMAERYERE